MKERILMDNGNSLTSSQKNAVKTIDIHEIESLKIIRL